MSKLPVEGLRFFPAAAETLQTVAARWPVAICSGALRAEIEYSLMSLDRLDQVAVIISAEDTTKCKPDPEGYQLALAALQTISVANGRTRTERSKTADLDYLAPSDCLVIEDSLAGIVSAKSAGMWAVGVPNTYTAEQLFQAGADDVIRGLATLTPAWIDRRFAFVNGLLVNNFNNASPDIPITRCAVPCDKASINDWPRTAESSLPGRTSRFQLHS